MSVRILLNRRLALAAVTLLLAAAATPALAAPPAPATARTEHASVQLRAERAVVAPGESLWLAVKLTSIPHWHTYWKNPGDTGLPTRISWTLPEGVHAGPIEWPLPHRLPTPPLMSFGYEGAADLLVRLDVPAGVQGSLPLRAKVNWLVCAEQCVPESAELGLELPVGASTPSPDAQALAAIAAKLPRPAQGWQFEARSDGRWLRLEGSVPEGASAPGRLWLFPDRHGLIVPAAAQPYHHEGRNFTLAVPLAPPLPAVGGGPVAAGAARTPDSLPQVLEGLLVADPADAALPAVTFHAALAIVPALQLPVDNGAAASVQAPPADATQASLLGAIVLAFAGGLLLNLMPCVLPVLSIKVFALLGDAAAPRRRLLVQGLVFLGGVLLSFWLLAGALLALKAAGASVGWGFQLQSPAFVAALCGLFTALAMNFAGVFEIGTGLQARAGQFEQRVGAQRSGWLASFSAGVLTTLVATPCTAPFLGAGIGFTLDRSAAEALLVFTAMGLGVGMPVTLLAVFPAWLRHLPRPGPWMLALKQAFAFPMLATVAWLLWVFGRQRGIDALGLLLGALVLVALACWLWGRAQQALLRQPSGLAGRLQLAAGLLALAAGLWLAWPGAAAMPARTPAGASGAAATDADGEWQAWSRQRLADLRAAGQPVFVDFTAAWCLSCQVNKRTSLRTAQVAQRMHALSVVPLEADWTNADPDITAELASLHRNAVPVYAVYPKGGGAPRLLPEVLTPGIVLDALEQAAGGGASGTIIVH